MYDIYRNKVYNKWDLNALDVIKSMLIKLM